MRKIERDVVYDMRELSELLKLHRGTLYRKIRDREIPAIKFGNRYRIAGSAVMAFLEAHAYSPNHHRPEKLPLEGVKEKVCDIFCDKCPYREHFSAVSIAA